MNGGPVPDARRGLPETREHVTAVVEPERVEAARAVTMAVEAMPEPAQAR